MTTLFDFNNRAFKAFVESAPVLCLAADRDFITTYVNPFYKKIHNITLDEAVGKHIKDIIGEEGFNDNLDYYRKTLAGNIVERHGSFHKLDGSIHHYHATYAPIWKEDEVVGITGVVLDITSEIEIEFTNKQLTAINEEFEKAQSELTKLASTDPLTNLYNRRYFTEISESIYKLAVREKEPVSIVMIDIDNFKPINDTYGHKAGDLVLIKLSQILTDAVRKSDVVCRFGGEEFIILLPKTGKPYAKVVAENVRTNIEANTVEVNNDVAINFTASLGISTFMQPEPEQLERLINEADEALYRAKELGKNQVFYEDQ
ncbi:MAG: diguanylate cyclase [Alteromonadaceae bacterium]|nr:diguanylate cyclase [Alteromonadaceae bacterium]